ncbi:hypothetical protein IG631_09513 [Alternaria alternata]|nr:hypothetical protein IG631_09513 [Alternaria alternata]
MPERGAGAGSRHLQQRAGHRLKCQRDCLLMLVGTPLRPETCPGSGSGSSPRPFVPRLGVVAAAAAYSDS